MFWKLIIGDWNKFGGWKIENMEISMNNFHTCFHTLIVYLVNSTSYLIIFFRFHLIFISFHFIIKIVALNLTWFARGLP